MKLYVILVLIAALFAAAPALAITNLQRVQELAERVTDGTVSQAELLALTIQPGNIDEYEYTETTSAAEVIVHWRNGTSTSLGIADRALLKADAEHCAEVPECAGAEWDPERGAKMNAGHAGPRKKPPAFVAQRERRSRALLPHLFGQPW
ncbi:hypothetical protein Q8F55_005759 [Vanrija albida]|uniref:Uncharacterized protein n=1 Tax=Vanrija albida TaxID=181172 RepID=A0ABR3Q2H0_9TREE